MSEWSWRGLCLVSTVVLAGCEQTRAPLGQPVCTSWKSTVGPLIQERCGDCHGAVAPAADLRLDEYTRAVAATRPRDSSAPMLAIFDGDATHRDFIDVQPVLERWIVQCNAAFLESEIHPAGIMDPSAPGFHAALLRDSGYDFEDCQRCHGENYAGGGSDSSCLACHPEGPTECVTCHGRQMRSGAHDAHALVGPLERPTDCGTCHEVPDDALTPGHLRLSRGEIDPPPAEVRLTGPAAWGPPTRAAPLQSGEPTYDPTTRTCVNVYCHGGAVDDPAAQRPTPVWTDATALDCSSCHGSPPADHPGARCPDCHRAVSSGPDSLTDLTLHLDGRTQFGPDSDDCGGCHGNPEGAPAPDLDGRIARTATTVGAHEPHLRPKLRLSAPVACDECHRVPQHIDDPGHIDSDRPAEVFPADAGRLARADGARPNWNRELATCEDTYCHGGGLQLGQDNSESKVSSVRWTAFTTGQVYCGSCHGIPPTSPPHVSTFEFNDCVRCHVRTVDAFGNILFDGPSTAHMNGIIDFDTGGGS